MSKKEGGLGIKNLRHQGIVREEPWKVLVKWIVKAVVGEEPWKVLVRNNLNEAHPIKGE